MAEQLDLKFKAKNIEDYVIDLVTDQACAPSGYVTADTEFKNLDIDSLDVVELSMAIEEKYNLDVVPSELVDKWCKVSDVIAYIKSQVKVTE